MSSLLVFGFLMGVRHSFEADHLAAVASLATRGRSLRGGLLQGVVWGLGHSLTLLVVGALCLVIGQAISERWARGLEMAVGLMMLALGADVIRRIRRQGIHIHARPQPSGASRILTRWAREAHAPGTPPHGAAFQAHPDPRIFPIRALLVGVVHGLAGSAALLLIALRGAPSLGAGLAYIAIFGVGSILGMSVLSLIIAVPLQLSGRLFLGAHHALEALVGLATLGIGARVLFGLGW